MMKIRLEQPKDYREVENLTREAFWNVYRPGCTEHFVLNQYRTNPDFIPELDFVMEEDNRIIGHVMFSKASLTPDPSPMGEGSDDPSQQEMHTTPLPHWEATGVFRAATGVAAAPQRGANPSFATEEQGGGSFPSWTFGPISIHPDYKRKGYGLKLLQYALEKAREMGVGFICMEGNIDFYKHAGFCLASKFNIHYHDFPKDAEVPFFLAQELIPGWLKENGITEAIYCPPKGYFVADENPEAFEAYEATFPKKVKLRLPGQLPEQ
jgi:predicted N-acetyltransferase YhbS